MAGDNFVLVSNELDDFAEGGGLYPGGTGIITDFKYVFWDYQGHMPTNSMVAVNCHFTPNDGSNEGKPLTDIFWNIGAAKDFQPSQDGGFLFGASGPAKTSCNWGFVLDKFRNTCGLEAGKLSQAGIGIKALIGTEVTLTRVDQPTREGLAPSPAAPTPQGQPAAQAKRKNQILIPVRCVFPWDKGGAAKSKATPKAAAAPKPGPVAVPSAATPAPAMAQAATATATATAPALSPASANGHGDATTLLTNALMSILMEGYSIQGPGGPSQKPAGAIPLSDIPVAAVTGKIGPDLTIPDRMALINRIKTDPAYLAGIAQANGWNWDGATLSV